MANTIDPKAIGVVLKAEYERGLSRAYEVLPFANREFEGDISKKGQTVEVPFVQVADWNATGTPGTDIAAGDMTIGTHTMTITQYKDIRMIISEKEISLLGSDMGTISEIIRQLQEKAATLQEDYFITKLIAKAIAGNKVTGTSNVNNIYAQVVALRGKLTGQNVPKQGRKLFVSSDIYGLMLEAKILNEFPAGYKVQSEGEVGRLAGFTVVETNAVADGTMIAYHDKAGNFVEKLGFLKVTEAEKGNYYNIVGALFFDADVLGEGKKKIAIHTQT